MANNSKIEWTHHTGNLWWGCFKVHEGCDNCYAEYLSDVRYKNGLWNKQGPRKAIKSTWTNFMNQQAAASQAGEVHRVFVGSMMDIFEKSMPLEKPAIIDGKAYDNTGHLRDKFFYEVVPNCPNIQFLLLTKRPGNINKMIPDFWKHDPPLNVMFGASAVNQKTFDEVTGRLQDVYGNRFLSIEPQLDWIMPDSDHLEGMHWVIQGGESGPKKRPFNLKWIDPIRSACELLSIPYFFKQIDKVQQVPDWAMVRQFPPVFINGQWQTQHSGIKAL